MQPDPFELVAAATQLVRDGFTVFPYCTDDLITCRCLLDAGCPLLMPWGAPIGAPSHAAQALEMGYDAVLLNSAVAQAREPVAMARAFRDAITAGRTAYRASVMAKQDFAAASTPVSGQPFLI